MALDYFGFELGTLNCTRVALHTGRDLKPQNVLVFDHSHGHLLFKLGDVGTARMADSFTTAIGTPLYRALEVGNQASYSISVDMYSFGIMLAEIVMSSLKHESHVQKEYSAASSDIRKARLKLFC